MNQLVKNYLEEMKWGAKFKPMFHKDDVGSATVLEFDKINDFDLVELPLRLQKVASE